MSTTQQFSTPNINAEDYYERLGVPSSADSDDVGNHTKKYVAQFKPELSDHDNADERWKRFNTARQTLNSPDSKDDYDTFRERFGPGQATEAYETWQANDALGSPETVSARDLGLESDVDESDSQQSQTTEERTERRKSSRQQRKQRASREERRRERARRRREGKTDIDTDNSKTYSTRAKDNSERTDTKTDSGTESSTFERVVSHVRSTVDLTAMEASTMLSLLEFIVAGYIVYTLVVEFAIGSISVPIVQDAAAVVFGLAILGVLSYEYLDRFSSRLSDDTDNNVGNQFTTTSNPAGLLVVPALFAFLWGLVLLGGGGALTILLLTVSVLSLYGRLRGLGEVVDLPEWSDYVEPVGGAATVLIFVALFVQAGQTTSGSLLTNAGTGVFAVVMVTLLVIIGAPLAAAKEQLLEYA